MSTEVRAEQAESHEGSVHIPSIQGESIEGLHLFGVSITNTIFSMWLFMAFLFVVVGFLFAALRTPAFPRLRAVWIDLMVRLDSFFQELIEDKKYARLFLPLVGGFFIFIFIANVFGLMLDWCNFVFLWGHEYLRPINSDLNTTAVMAVTVIIVSQITAIRYKWFFSHFGHYLFNWSGHSLVEKMINVPIGWLHFVGEFTRVLSLSVRLFANIFAGVILIGVMAYVGTLIPGAGIGLGGIIVVPFWFFELFVAFLQAYIFLNLSALYLKESITHEAH